MFLKNLKTNLSALFIYLFIFRKEHQPISWTKKYSIFQLMKYFYQNNLSILGLYLQSSLKTLCYCVYLFIFLIISLCVFIKVFLLVYQFKQSKIFPIMKMNDLWKYFSITFISMILVWNEDNNFDFTVKFIIMK